VAGAALVALAIAFATRPTVGPAPRAAAGPQMRPSGPGAPPSPGSVSLGAPAAPRDDAESRRGTARLREELPASLRGTEVDGALRTDAGGHLVPDPDALSLFDYFLSASGEEPLRELRERIVRHIEGALEEPARGEAVRLLDQYLGFRDELRALAQHGNPPADLERRLQWIRELRRKHFGAETANALFGRVERVQQIDLDRRRIALDPTLGEERRERQLEALNERLPASVREARESAHRPARTRQRVAALRLEGASDAEIFAAREQAFGREAALRLSELDRERARWQARLSAFNEERAALAAEGGSEAELDALVDRHFEGRERLRVRSLEGR